jgi:hypothetical protein
MLSYMLGSDPSQWRVGLRTFREITYRGIYPGIDLMLRASVSGLKYEWRIAPGADPSAIQVRVDGEVELSLDASGALAIEAAGTTVLDARPVSFQSVRDVDCRYRIHDGNAFGFECSAWSTLDTLVIDPLLYSTYLGGSLADVPSAIAVDDSGNAVIVGNSFSADFPATAAMIGPGDSNGTNVFVAKINPSGTGLVFATVIGGSAADVATDVAVDPSGEIFLTGTTNSSDFPTTTAAWRPSYPGGHADGFAARLSANGTQLVYSTFLGGMNVQMGGIAVGPGGRACIAGTTNSASFPVTPGAFSTVFSNGSVTGPPDAFVLCLTEGGDAAVFSTFLGGSSQDSAARLVVDGAGNVVVTGFTTSSDFPVTGGTYDNSSNGFADAFVVKLNATGSSLDFSSYLGGSQSDFGLDVALVGESDFVVLGFATSQDFPTTYGSFQPGPGNTGGFGTQDAFVARFDPSTAALKFSTYFGGPAADRPAALAVDAEGDVYTVGTSQGGLIPTTPNAQRSVFGGGGSDVFLAKISPTGSVLDYSTYLGGSAADRGVDVKVCPDGAVLLLGQTNSSDIPTSSGASGVTPFGDADAFVWSLQVPSPTLFLTSPSNGTNVSTPAVWVSGVTDPGVNLTVNGIRVAVGANGSFGVVIALLPGATEILATATDARGNVSVASVWVAFVDPLPGLMQEIASLEARMTNLWAQLNITKANVNATNAELNESRSSLSSTSAALNVTARALSATQAELNTTMSLLNDTISELSRMGAEASENATVLAGILQTLHDEQTNLSSASATIAAIRAEVTAAADGLSSADARIAALEAHLEESQRALDNASARSNSSDESLARARADLAATRAELSGLRVMTMGVAVVLGVAFASMMLLQRRRRRPAP